MGAPERLCAVSVDLDEIHHYFAIHGLQLPGDAVSSLVYDLALDRFDRLSQRNALPLTLFAVGADLKRPAAAKRLRRMRQSGHEVANHSLDHRYDLTRLSRAEMSRQVAAGADVIEDAVGTRPGGFRAPGYTVTDELFEVLAEQGVAYDSSVFPSVPYYAAKVAAMGMIRVRGRQSHSVLDSPKVLAAPTRPYRIGVPYWRRGNGMVELPVQVTPLLRYPFIGTFLTMAGRRWAGRIARMVSTEHFVSLELHGIDLLDDSDGLTGLVGHQPDVRIPWSEKFDIFCHVFDVLRRGGFRFVTCDELSQSSATHSP